MEYTYIHEDRPVYATTEIVVARIINFVTALIETLLLVRLFLHFIGAASGNTFMLWLDGVTDSLIAPFAGIFPALDLGGFQLELTTIFAMVVYSVVSWILIRIVYFLFGLARTTPL